MRKQDLTQGPITKSLLLFSLPMMAGNLMQQIYNIADTLIVGRFIGAEALAAVGSAYTLMTFLSSVVIGLCMGSGALFAESEGAGATDVRAADTFLSMLFIGGVTLLMYLLLMPQIDTILRLMQIPAEVLSPMREYTSLVLWGIGFISVYNFCAYLLRSVGNSTAPLIVLAAASILNVILDLYFVIVLHWGVRGAALATVIAQGCSAVASVLYIRIFVPYVQPERRHMRFDGKRFRFIVRNDIMTGIQQSVMNFGILMIQGLVNTFGAVIMAAFAASVKIDTIAYMPAQEFGNAYSLFISQNYGAGKEERIHRGTRNAIGLSFGFCAAASLVVWIFAAQLMGLFVKGSQPDILREGIRYLHIEGACYFGIGVLFLLYGLYRGIGKPQMSLVLTVISLGTRVLLAYTLAPGASGLGVAAIWAAIPIGWVLADLTGIGYYLKNRKKLLQRPADR